MPNDLERNEAFRFLAAATPDLLLVLDDDGRVRYAGEDAEAVTGMRPAALVGRLFAEFVHPEDRARLPEPLAGLAANPHVPCELRLRPSDAEGLRWVNVAARDARAQGIGLLLFLRDVTATKRREHEAWLLRRAVDAANNLIVIADAQAEDEPLVFVNAHFLEVTGYAREEILGQNCRFLQYRPDGTRDGEQEGRYRIQDALARGEPVTALLRNYRKDGTMFWNELYISPVRDAHGRVTHFVGVQNDVTEREEARQEVVARERLLRSFYDSAPVMMGVAELEGPPPGEVRYRFVNRASTEIFERRPEEVAGKTARELGFPATEARRWAEHYHASRTRGEPVRFETYYPWESDPEGEGVRTLTVVVNYLGEEGGTARFSFIAENVTERLRGERARRLLEAAVESTAEPLLITSPELDPPGPRILYANPAFERMTGYTRAELLGKTPRVLQGPKTDRALLDRLRRQLEAGRPFRGETVNYRKDGSEYVVEWEIAAIRDGDGRLTHWVATQRDVTQRRLLEHQVLDASSRAQERIGQDLHDNLGQLLTGASFLARSLAERLAAEAHPQAAEAARVAELVRQGIEQARALARGLHPVDIEAGGLGVALERLAESVRDVYEIACTVEASVPPGAVRGARVVDLYRIAQEAVTNAIRHGRARRIRLRLGPADAAARADDPEAAPHDLLLEIADDGVGIPDEALEEGGGMGLHTMRYRARRLGGTLTVRRAANGGTVVRCRFDPDTLPIEDGALARRAEEPGAS